MEGMKSDGVRAAILTRRHLQHLNKGLKRQRNRYQRVRAFQEAERGVGGEASANVLRQERTWHDSPYF